MRDCRNNKMKVLIINYRYFISGGPERYMFNLTQALEDGGHEVIPFSIRYKQNRPSPYAEYFVPPLAGEEEVYYKDQTFTPRAILKTLSRLFYAFDVELGISKLVSRTQPDVAYVLHYLRKLSPSLLTIVLSL